MFIEKFYAWNSNKLIEKHLSYNLYTNLFGLARSLLAMSLFITLLCNRFDVLYPHCDGIPTNSFLKVKSTINDLNFFLLFGVGYMKLMYYIAVVFLFFIVIGFLPAVFCFFHWWIQFSFINSSSCIDGGDQIAANLCLLFIPIFLFDNRKWHWEITEGDKINFYKKITSNIVYKLIRLQICVIYFHSSTGKFSVEEWKNGTSIYYWINNSFFRMSPNLEPITMALISSPLFLGILTWGTIIIEILLSFCLVASRDIRKKMFVVSIILHFIFMMYFGLVSFFLVMCCGAIFYLYNPNKTINFARIWKHQL